jgi:hypothetical protein
LHSVRFTGAQKHRQMPGLSLASAFGFVPLLAPCEGSRIGLI